jgi:proteic killer suppression protein
MIKSFAHKGLGRFYGRGTKAGIQAKHANTLRVILGLLDAATGPEDLNAPALRLHKLSGERSQTWSVKVSGNWRITFTFEGEDIADVDYEDYH